MDRWRFVELARYVPNLNSVIRLKRDGRSILLELGDEVEEYRAQNKNIGIYISVFRHDSNTLEDSTSFKGPLFFDIDNEDLSISLEDTNKLVRYLTNYLPLEAVEIYFSGAKGFHVQVAEKVLGVTPDVHTPKVFKLIAENIAKEAEINSFDFAVYESRRMWRLINSQHQKTGLFKVELPPTALDTSIERIQKFAEIQRPVLEHDRSFRIDANEWYKSFVSIQEQSSLPHEQPWALRRLMLFDKYGTSVLDWQDISGFDTLRQRYIDNIISAGNNSRNITLNKQAFMLYLNAMEQGVEIGNETMHLKTAGLAIGLEEREVDATLRSAERAAKQSHMKGNGNG